MSTDGYATNYKFFFEKNLQGDIVAVYNEAGTIHEILDAVRAVELAGGVTLKTLEVRPRRMVRDGRREPVRFYVDPGDVQVLTE